jgi:hypothetical protein
MSSATNLPDCRALVAHTLEPSGEKARRLKTVELWCVCVCVCDRVGVGGCNAP